MAFFKKTRVIWYTLAILLAGLVCVMVVLRIAEVVDYHNSDFFTFYLAGYLTLHGGDPYSPAQWVGGHEQFGVTWIPNQAYVYPLPLSALFAPLGLLPLREAYITWVSLSAGMILVSLFILSRLENHRNAWRLSLPVLVGLILFRPTTISLMNGQPVGLLLLILAGVLYCWSKDKWEWGAFLASLLMLKPNIGAPSLLLLVVWLVVSKKYKAILALGMGGLVLLLVGMIQNPAWVSQYLGIGSGKMLQTFGWSPTVWGLGSLVCDFRTSCTWLAGGSFAALFLVLTGYMFVSKRVASHTAAISLAVTLTLLITPYTWTYDQLLLLIPICAVVYSLGQRKGTFLVAALLFLAVDILALILLYFSAQMGLEILNAFIPMVLFFILLGTSRSLLTKQVPGGG